MPVEVAQRVKTSGLTFLVFNLYIGISVPGIDLAAHLGGWASGVAGGLLLGRAFDGEAFTRQPWRPLLLALGGGAAVFLAAYLVPREIPPSEEYSRVVKGFAELETVVNADYKDLFTRVQDGKAAEAEMAELLERSILPRWCEAQRGLRDLTNLSRPQQRARERLLEYTEAREEAWDLLARAIRTQDPALSEKAAEKFRHVEVLVERMKKNP
jgi:rhomboid protease GluP